MNKLLTFSAVFSLASVPAFAQLTENSNRSTTSMPVDSKNDLDALDFRALDTNGDGIISTAELQAGGFSDETLFGDIDSDRNGSISETEITVWNRDNRDIPTDDNARDGDPRWVDTTDPNTTGSNPRGSNTSNSNKTGSGMNGTSGNHPNSKKSGSSNSTSNSGAGSSTSGSGGTGQ